jgi:DNA repair exonuclease SbcCD ATPase subunit
MDKEEVDHACGLCKSPFGEESAKSRIHGLINDISQQIKQSKRLQDLRAEEIEALERKIATINAQWEKVNERYKLAVRTPSTELRNEAKQLYRQIGFQEQELVNLGQKEALIKRISELSDRKANLQSQISKLQDLIEAKERELGKKLTIAYTKISDNTCEILRQDLDRQSTFEEASDVKFNFGDNWLSVNGERFFSASSMVLFKNSFMLSMLQTALQTADFRHPRFLIMDTIEDKGIEPQRSHNFQMLMKEISENSNVEHQLIYATSMLAPRLEGSDYIVGRHYTHKNRTLDV